MPTENVYIEDGKGNLLRVEQVEIPPEFTNSETMRKRLGQALDGNAAFLAVASPTAAQNAAQVRALTRQTDALIRLALGRLDDTTGT